MRGNSTTGGIPDAPPPIYETKKSAPKWQPCPTCGKKGRRKFWRSREVQHLAHKQPVYWIVHYGVYKARCTCCEYFTGAVDEVIVGCHYTEGVRRKVIDLLIRDHLSVYKVQRHLREDFYLEVSVGFIYDCFQWAYKNVDRDGYWKWVRENFSGALCIDEVHDSGRTILVATDPVNDFTVAFLVVPKNNQRNMNRFLNLIQKGGIDVRVAITDGSPLYKKALVERWKGLEHQLCLFHFLRDAMTHVLKALRTIRAQLPVNAPHRRGRPPRKGRPRKDPRWRQKLLDENMHLVIKDSRKLTRSERAILRQLYKLDPRIRTLRRFTQQLHEIFKAGSPQAARNRRTRILRDSRFQKEPLLAPAMKDLAKDEVFEKLIVSLSWHRVPRTNNHVERKNRAFRLVQKTRYKRRLPHMIKMAYWLHIDRDWKHHPLVTDVETHPVRIRRRARKRRRKTVSHAQGSVGRQRAKRPCRRAG